MKKQALPLCAALSALTLTLAACGGNKTVANDTPADTLLGENNTASGTLYSDAGRYSDHNSNASANTTLRRGSTDSAGASSAVARGSTTTHSAADQTRYQQMLENGRVHDQDGFLLDGENSRHKTFSVHS